MKGIYGMGSGNNGGLLTVAARVDRTEEMLLQGCTYGEIARAFGCTVLSVDKYVRIVFIRWRDREPQNTEEKRRRRIAELEWSKREAAKSWLRSKGGKERTHLTFIDLPCKACHETGKDPAGQPCPDCGGEGKRTVEKHTVKRTKGRPGAVKFLAEYRSCVQELAKLEGLVTSARQTNIEKTEQHLHLYEGNRYMNAPANLLLDAREALHRLEKAAGAGRSEGVV